MVPPRSLRRLNAVREGRGCECFFDTRRSDAGTKFRGEEDDGTRNPAVV